MEEYYSHLHLLTHKGLTPVSTLDRWKAHYSYPEEETCQVVIQEHPGTVTFSITDLEGTVFSSTAVKPEDTTYYSLNILNTLNTSFDAVSLIGLRWLTNQALKPLNLSPKLYSKTETTLTLLNLHYHVRQIKTNTPKPSYYTIKELKERIPLALTNNKMRDKIFLSLNNKTLLSETSTTVLPEAWFQKLNS